MNNWTKLTFYFYRNPNKQKYYQTEKKVLLAIMLGPQFSHSTHINQVTQSQESWYMFNIGQASKLHSDQILFKIAMSKF